MKEIIASSILAAGSGPTINTTGVVAWVVKYIIPFLFLFIGVYIIANSRRGRFSDNMSTITNAIIGLIVIAGAALLFTFATQFATFVFG